MRYLLSMEVKEPVVENLKNIFALESERRKKGIILSVSGKFVLQWHNLPDAKSISVVDVDDELLVAKWAMDYAPYAHVSIVPIVERSTYEKKWGSLP